MRLDAEGAPIPDAPLRIPGVVLRGAVALGASELILFDGDPPRQRLVSYR